MTPILLKNPEAPASAKQLFRLHQLTGEDYRDVDLTMQQASDKIAEYESGFGSQPPEIGSVEPFNEAHVTMVEGDQGSGKNTTASGMVVDDYYTDCVRIYCEKYHIAGKVKGYDCKNRIARLKVDGQTKYIRISDNYSLRSPKRIFANFHLYGGRWRVEVGGKVKFILKTEFKKLFGREPSKESGDKLWDALPYVWIPSFGHLLAWLKAGLIVNGWLLIDEYYIGGNARDSMTAFGKELEKQGFQMRKMQLDVILITPIASLIDKYARLTPTKHILCAYDKIRKQITLTIREKGKKGSRVLPPVDARQYFPHFWTNERINK